MNDRTAKQYLTSLTAALLGLGFCGLAVCYILDPFQVFHRSFFAPDRYIPNYERFQDAGLINSMMPREDCCETVIIGTSHSQNFLPSHVAKVMGGKGALQLSLSGSLPAEQRLLLERVSQYGEIKNVIWDIHDPYAEKKIRPLNDPEILQSSPGKYLPVFLYDRYRLNDYFYLSSIDNIFNTIRALGTGKPYEKYQSWYDQNLSSFGKGKELAATDPNVWLKTVPDTLEEEQFPNITDVLIPLIKKHPEQTFYIFIPPYSRHYYAIMDQVSFNRAMAMHYRLAKELADCKNAKLFIFDEIFNVDDLDDYKDFGHFSENTSKHIIESMKAGSGEIRASGMKAHIARITADVNRYVRNFKSR